MKGLRFIWRWLSSRRYRSATDEYRRTRTQLRRQRDLIPPEAAQAIRAALDRLRQSLLAAEPPAAVQAARDDLRATAYACLEDPRRHRVKDGVETLFAAVIAVLALRTFVATPMQVPTSSMQPTLYGVTIENLRGKPDGKIPQGWQRLVDRFVYGRSYYELKAETSGRLRAAEPPQPVNTLLGRMLRLRQQLFQVGETWYTLTLPRLELPAIQGVPTEFLFLYHAGLEPDRLYRPGESLVKLAITSGDHLLIDRLSVNFRRLRRGEIVVFRAQEIPRLRENAFYLKRVVAFGDETVQIGDDRHVRINGRRLDNTTPYFEDIYDFRGPPADGEYSGHIHDGYAKQLRIKPGTLAPEFPDGRTVHRVAPDCIFVLGDNTVSSYDSRKFGDLPQSAVVGRVLAVYWPLSPRFGFRAD